MTDKNYLDDINEIKKLMNRSSRFISLSGLSGVLIGIYALLGSFYAYTLLEDKTVYIRTTSAENAALVLNLMTTAFVIAFLAILTALFLTQKRT